MLRFDQLGDGGELRMGNRRANGEVVSVTRACERFEDRRVLEHAGLQRGRVDLVQVELGQQTEALL
jgi:hypothetical protein